MCKTLQAHTHTRCPHPCCGEGEPFTTPYQNQVSLSGLSDVPGQRIDAYTKSHEGFMYNDLQVERDKEQWCSTQSSGNDDDGNV